MYLTKIHGIYVYVHHSQSACPFRCIACSEWDIKKLYIVWIYMKMYVFRAFKSYIWTIWSCAFYHRVYLFSFNYAVYRHAICTRRLCSNRRALYIIRVPSSIAQRDERQPIASNIIDIHRLRLNRTLHCRKMFLDCGLWLCDCFFFDFAFVFNSLRDNFLHWPEDKIACLNVIDRFRET